MDSVVNKDFARLAAAFWANYLREDASPSALRDAGYANEGPEGFKRGAMIDSLLGSIRKNIRKITPEEADRFEEALFGIVTTSPYASLNVDYHPSKALHDAFIAAGLEEKNIDLRFPWKTSMCLCDDVVTVHEGNTPTRCLVMTKRHGLIDLISEVFNKSTENPFREGTEGTATDEVRVKYWGRLDRIQTLRRTMPEMPLGKMADLACKAMAYVLDASAELPTWETAPPTSSDARDLLREA